MRPRLSLLALSLLVGVACLPCQAGELAKPQVLIVRAENSTNDQSLGVTGDIEAQVQASLSFRISGKISRRNVEIGQHVARGDELASLDTQQQEADVRAAIAQLAAAQANFVPARIEFQRQAILIKSGDTTGVKYDTAQEAFRRTEAMVISAQANVASARDQLSYTTLSAPADGVIIARNAEAGEVVQPGQAVMTLATDGPRDAVFKVSEITTAHPPISPHVEISLTSDQSVRTNGTVREISPAIDPTSNTVLVKVGLAQTPAEMTLGSAVVGTALFSRRPVLRFPWSALFRWNDEPAVWVIGADNHAQPHVVQVLDYETTSFEISSGVAAGDAVVVAGGQFLRPGVAVSVLASPAAQ